jgi:hypothetical protein
MRLFNVHSNVSLTLLNLTLADGFAQGQGATQGSDPALIGYGGCIASQGGNLVLSNCVLISNSAVGGSVTLSSPVENEKGGAAYGGAIYSLSGQITLLSTTIQQCGAQGGAGVLEPSTFGGPGGDALGGAVYAANATVTVSLGTFETNSAVGGPMGDLAGLAQPPGSAFGGALYASNCIVSISNVTFSANSALSPGSRFAAGMNLGGGGALYLAASTTELKDTWLSGNRASGSGGAQAIASGGGAIFNDGSLAMVHCQISGNSMVGLAPYCGAPVPACGGALFNSGRATILMSALAGNRARGSDGGQQVGAGCGGLAVPALGGAVYNMGQLSLAGSTFSSNSAVGGSFSSEGPASAFGGALFDSGNTQITNNTFFGNFVTSSTSVLPPPSGGGAIGASNATMVLVNVTVAGNNVGTGGVSGGIWSTNSTVTLFNSILANPNGNCAGSLTDGGNNLSSDGTCSFSSPASMNSTDPVLGPLAAYGGSLPLTMPLLAGSPAIDHGNDAVAPPTDERGRARPYGRASDIGAFESSPPYTIRGELTGFWPLTRGTITAGNASSEWTGDARGPFVLEGLAEGTYAVTPGLTNFIFKPASQTVTVGPDVMGLIFKAFLLNGLTPELSTNSPGQFTMAGQPGDVWQVQRSTNLTTWQTFSTNVIGTDGLSEVLDTNGSSLRFYRAKQ